MTFFISSITPANHLAFFEHGPIHLDSGVTLVLGKNNTGKTSLLRSLTLEIPGEIHNGPLNRPSLGIVKNGTPEIRILFEASVQTLRDVLSQFNEYSILSRRIDLPGNMPMSVHANALEKDLRCECALAGIGNASQLRIAPSYMGLPIPGAIN